MDANGKIVAVGGNSDYGTSIYDSTTDGWTVGGVSTSCFTPSIFESSIEHLASYSRSAQ